MPHFTPDNFHNCHLGLLLGRAAILKDRIIDTHMEPHGITAAQFKVLIIMAQFGVDTPSCTRMIHTLNCAAVMPWGSMSISMIRTLSRAARQIHRPRWHSLNSSGRNCFV